MDVLTPGNRQQVTRVHSRATNPCPKLLEYNMRTFTPILSLSFQAHTNATTVTKLPPRLRNSPACARDVAGCGR